MSLPAMWPLLQTTLGATLAWIVALRIAGHADPFFAPMSAVVALNAPRGERGLQAIRLVLGVMVGIAVGEGVAALPGPPFAEIAMASLVAMAIAQAARGNRLVVIQAGVSAILTVAAAGGEAGLHRLIDALIGGGVALLFSQVLFSPEPVALLRRAQTEALQGVAGGLTAVARALQTDDRLEANRALDTLREVRDRQAELARLRKASHNIARHSVLWRSQLSPVVRERENADHLDLLSSACIMLARNAIASEASDRRDHGVPIRELADAIASLAKAPGDRSARQQAADRALDAAREYGAVDETANPDVVFRASLLRVVAADIMVVAGVDPVEAHAALRQQDKEPEVPRPPQTPRVPFGLDRLKELWPSRGSSRKLADGDTHASDQDHEK